MYVILNFTYLFFMQFLQIVFDLCYFVILMLKMVYIGINLL